MTTRHGQNASNMCKLPSEFVQRVGEKFLMCQKVQLGDVSNISRNRMLVSAGHEKSDED